MPITNIGMATTPVTQPTFDNAYWASFPPAVAALRSMPVDNAAATANGRTETAMTLATQGYLIDVPIMVWGWDAFLVMTMRQQFGYTWVPSALMAPVEMAPGITTPGAAPYNPNPPYPAGAIVVSTSLASYPPFNPPAPPTPPPVAPTSLVGIAEGAGYYQAFPQALAALINGQVYTADPRGAFTFHTANNPFAPNQVSCWFTINS